MKKRKITPLQITIHILGWLPIALILFDHAANNLSVNPIQEITQRLGRYAIYFLTASLACTPLNTLFGWRELIKRRRALGLYSFLYAFLHAFMFLGIDYGFSLDLINEATLEKPYMLMGITGFLILLPLAITSFKWAMKRMGSSWKRLHKLVYAAGVIIPLHFAWARKGNLATLSGDVLLPAFIAALIGLTLLLRIPVIRKNIINIRQKLSKF